MAELKPCPFCGGEALVWTQNGKYDYFAYIRCDTCSARSKTVVTKLEIDEEGFWDSTAYIRLVAAWNRRAEDG